MGKPPTLAEITRTKLDADRLPREDHIQLCVGYGQNDPCAACERVTLCSQVQHELQFGDGRLISMHLGCAGPYEAEWRPRGWVIAKRVTTARGLPDERLRPRDNPPANAVWEVDAPLTSRRAPMSVSGSFIGLKRGTRPQTNIDTELRIAPRALYLSAHFTGVGPLRRNPMKTKMMIHGPVFARPYAETSAVTALRWRFWPSQQPEGRG
jgi:hypothetical protein